MGRNTTEMERAVARTLRDSLEKLQRNADEVSQAVGDLVSACASAKPSNTLPHMLRAQTASASLAASLDVMARFITSAMQPGWNSAFADYDSSSFAESDAPAEVRAEAAPAVSRQVAAPPPPPAPAYEAIPEIEPEPAAVEETLRTVVSETEAFEQASAIADAPPVVELPQIVEPAAVAPPPAPAPAAAPAPAPAPVPVSVPMQVQAPPPPVDRPHFDLSSLPPEQQELHRRANRVAKVSMQDIKMLRPADVRAGKESNDLCARLRDDIERAHKEYERRFHAILDHPVDYFYAWMVEILGEGDPRSLGEYPYPSSVARR